MLDLHDVPLIDGHCHPPFRRQPESEREFKQLFTESRDSRIVDHHVQNTLFYQQSLKDIASLMGLEEVTAAEVVLARRKKYHLPDYLRLIVNKANILGLVVDYGYRSDETYGHEELKRMLRGTACQVRYVLRLEPLIERLILDNESFESLLVDFLGELTEMKARGVAALKSIIAYRTGLAVENPSTRSATRAFQEVKREAQPGGGRIRIASKPLLDFLTRAALETASKQGVPVQFHTGLGDTDMDMLRGNPLLLRPLLEDPAFRDAPMVLLHCYPYLREAAYLSNMYGNVYVDLSMTLPVLTYTSAKALEDVLGLAPTSKLLYGSDAPGLPDYLWIGALRWRRALGPLLSQWVEGHGLSMPRAREIANQILWKNNSLLYQMEG